MKDIFLLPDRFEGLKQTAENKDITKIVIPVDNGINTIREIYEEIQ